MKPGWIRRLGSNIAVISAISPVVFLIVAGHGNLSLSESSTLWFLRMNEITVPLFLIGIILAIFGGAKTRNKDK
jgi:hypothetical protein